MISLCNRYLNSQMKSYMPWGMNIYQAVSYDLKVLKEKHAEVPISVEYIMQLKEIVSGIDATDYQVENVSGKVIKEIVNKRIK